MLRALLKGQTSIIIIAIILHPEEVVASLSINLGVCWCLNDSSTTVGITSETWEVSQTSWIVCASVLIDWTLHAIIIGHLMVNKRKLVEVGDLLLTVWPLIGIIIKEPCLCGIVPCS